MKGFVIAAAVIVALSQVGCGSDSEGTVTKSCTQPISGTSYNMCSEVTAAKSTVDQVMSRCSQAGGTVSEAGCSTSGAVGKCTFGDEGGTQTTYLYSPIDKTQAETFCGQISQSKGTFTAL